jgi:hypothetical protein
MDNWEFRDITENHGNLRYSDKLRKTVVKREKFLDVNLEKDWTILR